MASVPLLPLLPEVFQVCAPTSAPLRAVAAVAGDMHEPIQEVLDSLDRVVDPFRTPEALLGYLSRWVDLDWLTLPDPGSVTGAAMGIEPARQRDLIANAADLSARRGTPLGLLRFLQLATGREGFEIDVDPEAFHLRVRVPAAASEQIELVRRIIGGVKPAHVTAEVLETGQVQAGSSKEAAGPKDSGGSVESSSPPSLHATTECSRSAGEQPVSESNRKPIIAAIVCAAVALLVWGTGVGAGGGNSSGSDGWQRTLSDMRRGQALQRQDLQLVAGSCLTSGTSLTVQGACTFSVEKFGGPFNLGPPTKEAKLTVLSGSVHLELMIEGVSATSNLAAGEHTQLIFGTSGGSLSVLCAALDCALTIGPDG